MVHFHGHPAAMAKIQGDDGGRFLQGAVKFYQLRGGVLVVADISGLPRNGFFAFHIHEGADCGGVDFANTGSHFDPTEMPHPMHAGDLPTLLSNNGRAYMAVLTDRFSIADILGKTVVVHDDPDDFRSQPAGNAGRKIGCGVIRRG